MKRASSSSAQAARDKGRKIGNDVKLSVKRLEDGLVDLQNLIVDNDLEYPELNSSLVDIAKDAGRLMHYSNVMDAEIKKELATLQQTRERKLYQIETLQAQMDELRNQISAAKNKENADDNNNGNMATDEDIKQKEDRLQSLQEECDELMSVDIAAAKETITKIKTNAETLNKQFDASGSQFVQEIREALGVEDEDAEVQVERRELTINDFTCAFTGVPFVDPMSNGCGGNPCNHHMSKAAVLSESRNQPKREFKCPVAGCPSKWSRATSTIDERFVKKMQHFLKKLESQTAEASKHTQANTVDLEDDDGYTQV